MGSHTQDSGERREHDEWVTLALRPLPVARVAAAGLFGFVVVALAAAVWAAMVGDTSFSVAVNSFALTNGVMGLSFGVCGVLLAWHRPRNLVGWLLLAAGVADSLSTVAITLVRLGAASGWPIELLRLLGTLFAYPWTFAIGLFLPLTLLLFPDGRPAGPGWRWVVAAAVLEGVGFVLTAANPAPDVVDGRSITPLLTIAGYAQLSWLWNITGGIGWVAIMVAALISLVVRFRRGNEMLRRQLLWLLLALLIVVGYAGVLWGVLADVPILGLLVIPLIPVSITIAILRYQLLDIRLVVARALLYGLLTAAGIALYVGLVATIDALLRSRISLAGGIVATVVIALAFNPGRRWLQRLIDRLFYGDRLDPGRTMSLVGARLVDAGGSGLTGVLDALRDSLRLPFAAIFDGMTEAARSGRRTELVHIVPLIYEQHAIGRLEVGMRSGQGKLTGPDLEVLDLLAGPLALAVHSTSLSSALQQSRVGIVGAREEERRRLRRDLHDGLGPALTGIAFKADAAQNLLAENPQRSSELLRDLRSDVSVAIADIRRLVYGLRPPTLDDLGLISSLRQEAARVARDPRGAPMAIELTGPATLPPLPAAVEVAAYRIVVEAMTNATRHAAADQLTIGLTVLDDSDLWIEISDNGTIASERWTPGVGLTSMRERAAELGGSCQAGPTEGGGGRVSVRLPLGPMRTSDPATAGQAGVPT